MLSFFIQVAQAYNFNTDSGLDKAAGNLGYQTGSSLTPESMAANVIAYALSFLGIIFLILAIYGGFTWMTSQGNEKKVDKAQSIILNAVIGLVIVALAYAISYFVVKSFSSSYLK